jgi:hypothetical protein
MRKYDSLAQTLLICLVDSLTNHLTDYAIDERGLMGKGHQKKVVERKRKRGTDLTCKVLQKRKACKPDGRDQFLINVINVNGEKRWIQNGYARCPG